MKRKGFTLLEVLISVALISVIAGISIPIYQSFQVRNDLDIATVTTVQELRRAQLLSQASDSDPSWGWKIQSGSMVLFNGATYVSRDVTRDETFDLPTSITPTGETEIVFAKFTGLPNVTGTITLTTYTNETRTITINAKGTISY